MDISELYILSQAPNPTAAENGRKLSQEGSFSQRQRSASGTRFWARCAGSGKDPYQVSLNLDDPEHPVCRCSCPSRQFPCKHALGLMFELLSGREFAVAEVPADLAEKWDKQAARAAKKPESAGTQRQPAAKKPNVSARSKKLKKQLEGLDLAERMINDLLNAGLATLAGTSVQTYEKLARDLGSYYLTGPQLSFSRMALAVAAIQRDPEHAEQYYAQAIQVLIALHATIQKGRALLLDKLEHDLLSPEDDVLYEALGGVWRLEELEAAGACQTNARLVQLSFDVSYDEARREFIDRGFWADLDTGEVCQTLNYRPVKALKYVREEDSDFSCLTVPLLCRYPGELNRRVRWESASRAPVTREDLAALRAAAQPDLAAAVKLVKNQIKNTLSPKYAGVLVPYARIGRIGAEPVLEDHAGSRIVLRDQPGTGEDHRSVDRLTLLPDAGMLKDNVLFGIMFYDETDRNLCLHPYSLVTGEQIVRLQY